MKFFNRKILILFSILTLLYSESLFSLEYDFSGKLSGLLDSSYYDENSHSGAGLRYIPSFNLEKMISDESSINLEISLNIYSTATFEEDKNSSQTDSREKESDLKLYRGKLRYTSPQTELRAGLQKLNFGPARLLRPLQWFDSINPTDPLKFTDGVYGLRFKYDALNNSSYWLYTLYGNDELKGFEILPSVVNRPEFGARIQYPLFNGEFAGTVHTRSVEGSLTEKYTENRIGFDGQWDVIIGLWFESMIQYSDTDLLPEKYLTMNTLGADYTFDMGNGLHVLMENMIIDSSDKLFKIDKGAIITAFSVNYPLGMIDSLSIMGYYLWDSESYLSFYAWNRIYDTFSFSLTMFNHSTDSTNTTASDRFSQMGSGRGFGGQFTLIYNH